MRNQRGFADIVILVGLLVCGLVAWKTVPVVMEAFHGGSKDRQVSTHKQNIEYPVAYTAGDGSLQVKMTKIAISDSDITAEQPTLSFWEKLQSLGAWAIVLFIAAIFAIPGFGIAIWNNLKAIRVNAALKNDAKKIVVSVDQALAKIEDPILKQKLLDAMSKVQDSTTKTLVSELKRV